MKFSYDWNDPFLAEACHELEIIQIKEHYWREARRRASLAALFLIPLLAALLAGSFSYLTRAQVSGLSSVLIVGTLGGLLGGVLACLRRLSSRVRRRLGPPTWPKWGLWSTLVVPLAFGAATGVSGALVVTGYGADGSYRPQTLYLVALATAVAIGRLLRATFVTLEESR